MTFTIIIDYFFLDFIIERSMLSSLIKYLVIDINKLWFCSTNQSNDPIAVENKGKTIACNEGLGSCCTGDDSDSGSDDGTRRRNEDDPLRLPGGASTQRPKVCSYGLNSEVDLLVELTICIRICHTSFV